MEFVGWWFLCSEEFIIEKCGKDSRARMDFDLVTKEAAAISLLKRAVELDTKKRNTEALICYKEGLQIFMDVLKSEFL